MVWNVVKPWVDEVTLKKIHILRDKEEIRRCMEERYVSVLPWPLFPL